MLSECSCYLNHDRAFESLFKEFLEPTLKEYLRSFFTEDEIESKLTDAKKLFVDETNPK